MFSVEIVQKPLTAVQLAARTVRVSEQAELAGVVGPTFDSVAEIIGGGDEPSGACRELYLRADESGRSDEFVVELQQPVRESVR